MRSKILVYFPTFFFIPDQLSFQFKQIKELGFEQIVLDGEFAIQFKNLEKTLELEKLSLFALFFNEFEDENKSILLMENLHALNCSLILSEKLTYSEKSKMTIQKMKESGIKILEKSDNFYLYQNNLENSEILIVENPLSHIEKPLQSSPVKENGQEKLCLESFKNKSAFFLIKPVSDFDRVNYLKFCKDILNRYYFLGVR